MTPKMFLSMWSSGMSASDKANMKRHLNEVVSAAVIAERERCAKECEDFAKSAAPSPTAKNAMLSCAAAIRALK